MYFPIRTGSGTGYECVRKRIRRESRQAGHLVFHILH